LVELCSALDAYRKDFVLAGGWAPYFLSRRWFDHCGSKDIDLVLKPSVMARYESIREVVVRLGYVATLNPFRFEKAVVSPLDGRTYRLNVDFLTEPESAMRVSSFVKVQVDLSACLIAGSSIVFKLNCEEDIEGMLPGDGRISVGVAVADVAGSLTMKGLALPRLNDKDGYDVYAIAGFHGGDPKKASEAYVRSIGEVKLATTEQNTVQLGLDRIRGMFGAMDSYGVFAVSRFMNADMSGDVFARVNAFTRGVSQTAVR
jgi:hypothetical protein